MMGNIEWQLGFDEATVETRLGKNFVQLSEEPTEEGDDTVVVLRLRNESGDIIDTIYPGSLHPAKPSWPEHTMYWQVFEAIFRTAARSARGVEKVLDEIIAELEKKAIPF
ncbi:MAG: hypothetical protein EOP50_13685 [Sphingobacteriales bacterium]|nr:MAG: hypothetical protein EOP50_13685 [Sphingobacteriales bacterium]